MATKKSTPLIKDIEVSLQAPWIIYGKQIIRLFDKDPQVSITTDYKKGGDRYTLVFDSPNQDKLVALSKILKNYIQMGNIMFTIEFNGIDVAEQSIATAEDWYTAFQGNAYFVDMVKSGPLYTYAVFSRDIITIYTDDLSDYCWNSHYIPANIVREVTIPTSGVSACTSAI